MFYHDDSHTTEKIFSKSNLKKNNLGNEQKTIIFQNIIDQDILPKKDIFVLEINEPTLIPIFIANGLNVNMIIHHKHPLNSPIPQNFCGYYENLDDFYYNVECPSYDIPFQYNYYTTLLIWYIEKNDYQIVKLLLENGADVNAKGYNNITALNYASKKGNLQIVEILLKYFPETILDHKNRTPLIRSLNNIHIEIAMLLIQYDHSAISIRNNKGENALMIAINNMYQNMNGSIKIINIIIKEYLDLIQLNERDIEIFCLRFQYPNHITDILKDLSIKEHLFIQLYPALTSNTPVELFELHKYLLLEISNERLIKYLIFCVSMRNDIEFLDILLSKCSNTENISMEFNNQQILVPTCQNFSIISRLSSICSHKDIVNGLLNSLDYNEEQISNIEEFKNNLLHLFSIVPELNLFQDSKQFDTILPYVSFSEFFLNKNFDKTICHIFCQNMTNGDFNEILDFLLSNFPEKISQINIKTFKFFLDHIIDINQFFEDHNGINYTLTMFCIKHLSMEHLIMILKYNPNLYLRDNSDRDSISYCSVEQEKYIFGTHFIVPNILIDSISLELFVDPYIASDGHTYSYESLHQIFLSNKTSPITRERLYHIGNRYDIGIKNLAISVMIDEFKNGKLTISS